MSKLQPVRGTHDLLPEDFGGEFEKFFAITSLARDLATLYGFKEMATPIFEPTEVFKRSLGDTSDIVHKEMFTFETKGGDGVTLRPEFTAGIVRAFLSNGLQQHLPLKLFSTGPLFRYERPQKGRQRQFHQVNFEMFGDANAQSDVEAIALAAHFIQHFELGKDITLHINTLGDKESRTKYREVLVEYFDKYSEELSEDSKRRLLSNPLRILDSKDEGDKKIASSAPSMQAFLSDASKSKFNHILNAIDESTDRGSSILIPEGGIKVDDKLVRGLDYYTDTVFEFVSHAPEMGAQSTVLAGGRYDGLVELMGGKPTPAIGFAAGIERLMQMSIADKNPIDSIYILPLDEAGNSLCSNFAVSLRALEHERYIASQNKNIRPIEIFWEGTEDKRYVKAIKRGARFIIKLGGDALKQRDCCIIKDVKTGTEKEVSLRGDSLPSFIEGRINI